MFMTLGMNGLMTVYFLIMFVCHLRQVPLLCVSSISVRLPAQTGFLNSLLSLVCVVYICERVGGRIRVRQGALTSVSVCTRV